MNFCSECGALVERIIPSGDNRPRHVCTRCGSIHYQNPKLVVGAIVAWEDKVLLCRRAIEPRLGKWTLPAGFMENGESTAEGATRETQEEAGARIALQEMFSVIDRPDIDQVHVFYRAHLLDLDFHAGEESLEVALFTEAEIPWEEIAFHPSRLTLRRYFEDLKKGQWNFHSEVHPSSRFPPNH